MGAVLSRGGADLSNRRHPRIAPVQDVIPSHYALDDEDGTRQHSQRKGKKDSDGGGIHGGSFLQIPCSAVLPDSSKICASMCGTTPQTLSSGTRGVRCQIPKNLSSVLACLKNLPTERATPFPASTTEKWQHTTDRYRLNIRKRGLPSANWSTGTRTSDDPAPTSGGPNGAPYDRD